MPSGLFGQSSTPPGFVAPTGPGASWRAGLRLAGRQGSGKLEDHVPAARPDKAGLRLGASWRPCASGSRDRCYQRRTWEPSEARAPCPACWQASWQAANFVERVECAGPCTVCPSRQASGGPEPRRRRARAPQVSARGPLRVSGPAKLTEKVVEKKDDGSRMPRVLKRSFFCRIGSGLWELERPGSRKCWCGRCCTG